MYKITRIDYGIHTIEVSMTNLKYSQVQRVNDALAKVGPLVPRYKDKDNVTHYYENHCFIDKGISTIRTFQSPNKSNGIFFAVNPQTMLRGQFQPVKLFTPSEEKCKKLTRKLKQFLHDIDLQDLHDSIISVDRLKLSQIDITWNLWFLDGTDLTPIIRLFTKSQLLRHFKLYPNNHGYFACGNNSVTIKAYDKIQELEEREHLPEKLR